MVQAMPTSYKRLRNEFLEMPGLRLTATQAQRLCGLDLLTCQAALAALVDAKFLRRAADGTFARLDDGRPANAILHAENACAATR